MRTLLIAAEEASRSGIELGILVWDNTPGGQDPGEIPAGARYEAGPDNPGLARAYNRGLEIAVEGEYQWLLTLDEDTALPPDFLVRLSQIAREIATTPSIASIVPLIKGSGKSAFAVLDILDRLSQMVQRRFYRRAFARYLCLQFCDNAPDNSAARDWGLQSMVLVGLLRSLHVSAASSPRQAGLRGRRYRG